MAKPQKIISVPDPTIDHRLTATTTFEAGNTIPDRAAPEIGDKMKDGTIYAGLSPDTGKAMYVTPADASGTLKWKQAMKYAADLDANGHKDWKLPTIDELNVLFENRAAIGGFDESSSARAGKYWSSTEGRVRTNGAWVHSFRIGYQGWHFKVDNVSVRPVRSELRP